MLYSECCGEMVYDDYDICSECLEHCDTWEDDDEELEHLAEEIGECMVAEALHC